jgi:hypothetical protein
MENFLNSVHNQNSDVYCDRSGNNWEVFVNGSDTGLSVHPTDNSWAITDQRGNDVVKGEGAVKSYLLAQSQAPTLSSDASVWHAIGKLADLVHKLQSSKNAAV